MEVSSFTTVTITNTAAYCNMTTDGGRWIVVQRNRKNSAVSFSRKWTNHMRKDLGTLLQTSGMDWQQCIV